MTYVTVTQDTQALDPMPTADENLDEQCAAHSFDSKKSANVLGTVLQTLRTVPAEVNFSLGPVSVSASAFKEVAGAIGANKVRIRVVSSRCFGNGAVAEYDATTNTITFADGILGTQILYLAIIHEAVHAYVDLKKTYVIAGHDEAAAIIATSLYSHLTHRNYPLTSLAVEASRIAVAIQNAKLPRVLKANFIELHRLYRLIMSHPAYGKKIFSTVSTADG